MIMVMISRYMLKSSAMFLCTSRLSTFLMAYMTWRQCTCPYMTTDSFCQTNSSHQIISWQE